MAQGRGITLFGVLKWVGILTAVGIAILTGVLIYALGLLTAAYLAMQFARGGRWATIVMIPAFLWGAGLGAMSALGSMGIEDLLVHAATTGVIAIVVATCGWGVLVAVFKAYARAHR